MHPFNGFTELCDDIPSLVEKVKKAIKHQIPNNIETVLYTIGNHNHENQESKERAKENRKDVNELPLDETYFKDKEELSDFLNQLGDIESAEVRGLTEQEREEFVKLYEKS